MRAAVLFGPGDIRVTDRPVPRPGPDEVLVKVAMCGMCGTDLKIFDGHFPLTPPFGDYTPGHEWTGTVAALGSRVDEFAVGDRVCIEAHSGCGRCDNCLAGKYTACLNYGNRAKGHRATGMTTDGGFAGYAVHDVGSLYALPPSLSFEDGVLITTAGTGLYGLDVAGGYVAGGRDLVMIIDLKPADSHLAVRGFLSSLPILDYYDWQVTPLESFEEALQAFTQG